MTAVAVLARYVKASPADNEFVQECLDEAEALVNKQIGTDEVPDIIRAKAIREVAADLYYRRGVRNGIASFDGQDLQPVRITRDPMRAADDILRPWLRPGIA